MRTSVLFAVLISALSSCREKVGQLHIYSAGSPDAVMEVTCIGSGSIVYRGRSIGDVYWRDGDFMFTEYGTNRRLTYQNCIFTATKIKQVYP